MRNQKVYASKKILNKVGFHGTAALSINIRLEYNKEKDKYTPEGQIAISDCHRTINLAAWSDGEDGYDNLIFKVSTLAKEFVRLERALKRKKKLVK